MFIAFNQMQKSSAATASYLWQRIKISVAILLERIRFRMCHQIKLYKMHVNRKIHTLLHFVVEAATARAAEAAAAARNDTNRTKSTECSPKSEGDENKKRRRGEKQFSFVRNEFIQQLVASVVVWWTKCT